MLTPIAGEMTGKEMASQQTWDQHSMGKANGNFGRELSFSFSLAQILPIAGPRQKLIWRGKKKERKEKQSAPSCRQNLAP